MHRRIPIALLCLLLACAADAAPKAKAKARPAPRPVPSASIDRAAQRAQFRTAYLIAQQGPTGRWRDLARGLEDYVLWPYLEAAALTHDLAAVDPKVLEVFIGRHAGAPFATDLRRDWLRELGDRARWAELTAQLTPADKETDLRCWGLAARIALSDTEGLAPSALELLKSGKPQPRACAAVEDWAAAQGLITEDFVWERIALALDARGTALARTLAARLPAPQRDSALAYARLIDDPEKGLAAARAWKDSPRARDAIASALARYASKDSAKAIPLWVALSARFKFDDAQRGRVLAAIAIDRAASYAADAAEWLAKVPAPGRDARLMEWRVREALARADWAAAQAALDEMPVELRLDPRWRYVGARIDEASERPEAARAALTELAREANFFGFLAADRLDLPYALCPNPLAPDAAERARIAALPAIQRAFELRELGWVDKARREWDFALRPMDLPSRAAAVALAIERGWNDRGPFTLTRPDEQRLYTLRFPLAHRESIEQAAARYAIDPALVLGLIRQESAWVEDAVSHAEAYGLMQVLPILAKSVAKAEKLPYAGAGDLYQPELNIRIGTSHLADVLERYDGAAWLALAAYNAGPTPVARWRAARGALPPDLWVQTIPYRETREYVERVLSFAVIYGWRLDGQAISLASRLAAPGAVPAVAEAPRRAISCATSNASAGAAR